MIELSKEDKEQCLSQGLKRIELERIVDSEDVDFYLDFLKIQGLGLIEENYRYYPRQLFNRIEEISFCIVDIETNGSDFKKNQIIELGAVMVKDGIVTDTFNSLIQAQSLPDSIARLTGITLNELLKAPPFKEVIHQFKNFAKDEIIVAHPLKFDYNFISESFEKADLGMMLNLGICSISLAEKTLSSAKYGLNYLNETLNLVEDFQQHRAYNDAVITHKIFQKSLENLPKEVRTVKDLLNFIKTAKKMPRAALVDNRSNESKN